MTSPNDALWQQSANQLRGLLAIRDGVEKLVKEHEARAKLFRDNGREGGAVAHERYTERLRKLLRGES